MKASKFTDAQKAFILKQGADGHPVAEICRKAGISEATYFNWKKKYDGLLPNEMRRLKQLEDENNQSAEGVADLSRIRRCFRTRCTKALKLSRSASSTKCTATGMYQSAERIMRSCSTDRLTIYRGVALEQRIREILPKTCVSALRLSAHSCAVTPRGLVTRAK